MNKRADPDRFYVYAHYTKDEGVLFYIGKGSGSRAWSTSNRNQKWRAIVSKHGIDVEILMCGLLESEAFRLEEKLTSKIGIQNLAVFTLGGGGTSGYEHTEAARKKMSSLRTGKQMSIASRHKMSVSISSSKELIELRRNLFLRDNPMNNDKNREFHSHRMSINNPMKDPVVVEKMRKSKTGRPQSEETRAKRSQSLRGRPWSLARREAEKRRAS